MCHTKFGNTIRYLISFKKTLQMSDTNRKLAVILAMDVVNYSAKMEQDEEKTLFTLRKCSEIIESIVDQKLGESSTLLETPL